MKRLLIGLLSTLVLCGGGAFAAGPHGIDVGGCVHPVPENPGEVGKAFTACERVTDCAILQTSCLGPVTVNKNSEKAYLDSLKDQPTIQCIRFVDPKEVCVACEENQCKIKSYKEDFQK